MVYTFLFNLLVNPTYFVTLLWCSWAFFMSCGLQPKFSELTWSHKVTLVVIKTSYIKLKFIFYFTFLSFLVFFMFGGGIGSIVITCSIPLFLCIFICFHSFYLKCVPVSFLCLEYFISYEYETLPSKCNYLHSASLS